MIRESPSSVRSSLGLACSLMLLASTLIACSDAEPNRDTTRDAGSRDHASASIGPGGGTLSMQGIMLEVPAGALDRTLELTIDRISPNAEVTATNAQLLSDVFEFGPPGTAFTKPIRVSFETDAANQDARVFFTKPVSKQFEVLGLSLVQGALVSAEVSHFSQGFAGLEDLDSGVPGDAGDTEVGDAATNNDATIGDASAGPTVITVHSHDDYGNDTTWPWAAFQDGDGAWQVLSPTNVTGTYQFPVESERYAVAFACTSDSPPTGPYAFVTYASTAQTTLEVSSPTWSACTGEYPARPFAVGGALNLPEGQYLEASTSSGATASGLSGTRWQIPDIIPAGVQNFSLVALARPELGYQLTATRFHIFYDVDVMGDIDDLDVDLVTGGTAVGPQKVLSLDNIENLPPERVSVEVSYGTKPTPHGFNQMTLRLASLGQLKDPFAFPTIPSSARHSGDHYGLRVRYDEIGGRNTRELWGSYATDDIHARFPDPLVVSLAFSEEPQPRPTLNFTTYPGARSYTWHVNYGDTGDDTGAASYMTFDVIIDPSALGEGDTHSITLPDFSGLPEVNGRWFVPEASWSSDPYEGGPGSPAAYFLTTNVAVDADMSEGSTTNHATLRWNDLYYAPMP